MTAPVWLAPLVVFVVGAFVWRGIRRFPPRDVHDCAAVLHCEHCECRKCLY